jgi:hypothetical protein
MSRSLLLMDQQLIDLLVEKFAAAIEEVTAADEFCARPRLSPR